eukprot:m.296944 g.296944  ORF g.296944 m.296944 type:complete len:100 (+) comp27193_c3_seq34:246-545(+)
MGSEPWLFIVGRACAAVATATLPSTSLRGTSLPPGQWLIAVTVGNQTLTDIVLDTGSSNLLAVTAGCAACHPIGPSGSNYTTFAGLDGTAGVVPNTSAR